MPPTDHEPRPKKPTLTLCQRIKSLLEYHEDSASRYATAAEEVNRLPEKQRSVELSHVRELEDMHADYAKTVGEIKAKLCKREIGPPKERPIINEVLFYGSEIGMTEKAARYFFDYFEARDWKLGGRVKCANWRARMRSWKHDNEERDAKQASAQVGGRKLADGEKQYKERHEMPEL